MAIHDMSPTHPLNLQNNSWTVLTEFPTDEEIQAKTKEKIYIASLWARKDEEIVFSTKFGRGSHMNVTWSLTTDANDAQTGEDNCETKAGSEPTWSATIPSISFQATAGLQCQFPFRYNDTLYYGCSNFTIGNDATTMCPTEIDEDYNAQKVGICNDYCHVQGMMH